MSDTNYMEQSLPSANGDVWIGHTKDDYITIWAYEEYGDEPSRLTPEQAITLGETLIKLGKEQ